MSIRRWLSLLVLVMCNGQALELDTQFYPQRLLWQNIENLVDTGDQRNVQQDLSDKIHMGSGDSRAFVTWDQGLYLRVRFQSPQAQAQAKLTLWYSKGDGLYQQMHAVALEQQQGQLDWLFARPQVELALVMLHKSPQQDSELSLQLDQSRHLNAPSLDLAGEVILHAQQQVQTNQSDGFMRRDYNQLAAGQGLQYELQGPAQYALVVRSRWFPEYGLAQLMVLDLQVDQQATLSSTLKLQPQTDYLLQTPQGEHVYSRQQRVNLWLPKGRHQVTVSPDRVILAHWTRVNASEQYFYASNSRPAHRQLVAKQQQDIARLMPTPDSSSEQAVIFYRQLSPHQALPVTTYSPLPSTTAKAKNWLPSGNYGAPLSAHFSLLAAHQRASYVLPASSVRAPLRLYLKDFGLADNKHRLKHAKPIGFSLVSDQGERIALQYLPASKLNQQRHVTGLSQARLQQSNAKGGVVAAADPGTANHAPLSNLRSVATSLIHFKQAYRALELVNNSDSPLEINLAYANSSKKVTDEIGYLARVNKAMAQRIIDALSQTPYQQGARAFAAKPAFDALLQTEVSAWQKRLASRANDFLRNNGLESDQQAALLTQIDNLLPSLGQHSAHPITDLKQLMATLSAQGLRQTGKKLIAALAMQAHAWQKWQQAAEQLLLDQLSSDERWFEIEGYWAYRLLKWQQAQALVPLSHTLLRQNKFSQASKWFWLVFKAQLLEQVPDEALLAARKSEHFRLLDHWLANLDPQRRLAWRCLTPTQQAVCQRLIWDSAHWYYWQPLSENSAPDGRVLLHNNGLDSYLSVARLNAGVQQPLVIAGPMRVKLTLYPVKDSAQQWPQMSWLSIDGNGLTRRYLLSEFNDSLNLTPASAGAQQLASPKTLVFELAVGEQLTGINSDRLNVLFSVAKRTDLLAQWQVNPSPKTLASPFTLPKQLAELAVKPASMQIQFQPSERALADQLSIASLSHVRTVLAPALRNRRLAPSPVLRGAPDSLSADTLLTKLEQVLASAAPPTDDARIDTLLLQALWLQHTQPLSSALIKAINAIDGLKPWRSHQLNWLKLINQGYAWTPLQNVISSGGEQLVAQQSWQASSAKRRLQQALLQQAVQPGERLLSSRHSQIMTSHSLVAREFRLELRKASRFGTRPSRTEILVQLDGVSTALSLASGQTISHPIQLSPGQHSLRLSLGAQAPNQPNAWVFFNLKQQPTDAAASLLPPLRRKYQVASTTQPLRVYVPGASWLRIDERDEHGQTQSQTRYVATAQTLAWHAKPGQGPRHFQLYQWQADKRPAPVTQLQQPLAHPQKPMAPAPQKWPAPLNTDFALLDRYPFSQQEDGTWSLFGGYNSRRNFDEDRQTSRERFYQLGWRYQLKLPDWRSYLSSELSLRQHQNSQLQTLLSETQVWWQKSKFWQFSGKLNAYYQSDAARAEMVGQWAVYGALSAQWRQYWQHILDNKLSLTAYARGLSLTLHDLSNYRRSAPNSEQGLALDDDVYSSYKATHRSGLRLANTLRYKPWSDTQWRLHTSLTSDKNGDFFNPHKLSLSIGIRQYWQPLIAKLDLQRSRYYSDKQDLANNATRDSNTLRLALTWEHWTDKGQLWQIDGYANRDLDGDGSSFGINLRWGQSQGQGFDDFAPGSLIFGQLRKRDSFNVIKSSQVVREDHE